MTDQNNRNKIIFRFLHSPTFRYQQTLILLLFVSATLIFLDLGLFSASFIFGAALILVTLSRKPALLRPKGMMWFLIAFLVIALISLFFSDLPLTFKHIKIYLQTIYWFLLSVVIYNLYPLVNKKLLSKYILYSVLILLVLYVLGMKVGSQNSVAFTVIILAPLSYFYIPKFWYKVVFASLLIFLMLLNGSRSGAIISLMQSGLIFLFSIPNFKKYFKSILLLSIVFLVMIINDTTLGVVGNAVYPYNQRLGELMLETDYVLRNDVSWLQREAQIQKGKQIFAEHPILGIGYTNFVEYDIDIDQSKIESDRSEIRNVDNRSAHNSYVNWLSETGILGIGTMLLFFVFLLKAFWRKLHVLSNTFESGLFISLFGLLIYFYTISSHLGTSTWIMYGIIAGGATRISGNRVVKI